MTKAKEALEHAAKRIKVLSAQCGEKDWKHDADYSLPLIEQALASLTPQAVDVDALKAGFNTHLAENDQPHLDGNERLLRDMFIDFITQSGLIVPDGYVAVKNKPTDNITEGALEALKKEIKYLRVKAILIDDRNPSGQLAEISEALRVSAFRLDQKVLAALQNAQPASVDVDSLIPNLIAEHYGDPDHDLNSHEYMIRWTVERLATQGYLHPKPGYVMVPVEPTSYDWYFDFIDRKPYEIQQLDDRTWAVIETPRLDSIIAGSDLSDETVFYQKFNDKYAARHCWREKMAEGLHKAMIAAAEEDR